MEMHQMNMQDRFEPTDAFDNMKMLDFEHSERVLREERQKAREYITIALY